MGVMTINPPQRPASPPLTRSYWVEPGRLLGGFMPGDRDPAVALGKLEALFDAGVPKFIFPARLLNRTGSEEEKGFSFYGPTCDTMDFMKGPFMLPADVKEGDYLEIGQLGAYGRTMATRFNGFAIANMPVIVRDEPLMSLYNDTQVERRIAVAARG